LGDTAKDGIDFPSARKDKLAMSDPETIEWVHIGHVIYEGVATEEEAAPFREEIADQEMLLDQILAQNNAELVGKGITQKVVTLNMASSIESVHAHDPVRGRILAKALKSNPGLLTEASQDYSLLEVLGTSLVSFEAEFEAMDREIAESSDEEEKIDEPGGSHSPTSWLMHSPTAKDPVQFRTAVNIEETDQEEDYDPLDQSNPQKLYVVIQDKLDELAERGHHFHDVGSVQYYGDRENKLIVPHTKGVPSELYLSEEDIEVVESCVERVRSAHEEGDLPNLVKTGFNDRLWVDVDAV
jgi:hypothetical protein